MKEFKGKHTALRNPQPLCNVKIFDLVLSKESTGSRNPLAILSKWYGLFTPDNIKKIWFLKLCKPKSSFLQYTSKKWFCDIYRQVGILLRVSGGQFQHQQRNTNFPCFSKIVEVRFLVSIIRYLWRNPVFLSLPPLPPETRAVDLGSG